MCGIIGYVSGQDSFTGPSREGSGQAAPILLKALKCLEYRGYDSAGIATIADGKIWVRKDVGNLDEVQQKHHLEGLPGNIGIGHVRWATHGKVTQPNAHPHVDCKSEIAVVHNGIIENYEELRHRLEPRHRFLSETDTEVVPHLLEDYLAAGISLEEALRQTTRQLQGSYALAVISAREPHKIVCTRKDSPLVIGIGKGKNFVASDFLSFLSETKEIIFIEDHEIASVTKDSVTFLDSEGREIQKESQIVEWQWEEATKQGNDFYMIKEIKEVPQAIRYALMQDKNLVMEMALDILRAKQVIITACGTSRYAGLIGRYLFSKLAGKFCDVIIGSELHYFSDSIDKNTLVIAISQSGETADVMEGVKRAKQNGAAIFSIVNVVGSSLARISDKVIYLNCGPEIGVAATKSFVSQLVILYMLAFAMTNKLESGMEQIREISHLIETNFRENGLKLKELADLTKDKHDFYYIARGINFAIATEGALKAKEIAYIHAEGMPAGELKHGTLALIEDGTPVVVICPRDYTFKETLVNAAETRARGAFTIGVSDENDALFDAWIKIPTVEDIFYPLATIMPLQLLAFHLAVARGKDPDKPRNLAKSVTVK